MAELGSASGASALGSSKQKEAQTGCVQLPTRRVGTVRVKPTLGLPGPDGEPIEEPQRHSVLERNAHWNLSGWGTPNLKSTEPHTVNIQREF